jgi:hypothetical protein
MSAITAGAGAGAGGQVVLPAGWSAGPPRETTQANVAGQIVQGVQVPISSSAGASATVFIPNLALEQGVSAVQPIFDAKIAALTALPS